ncbi:MAG TPA: hypothetical protein VN456_03105, partial [Desulfosporosinus sp.]|nr:hypothetical protein [Desulfosporosinus sp.]
IKKTWLAPEDTVFARISHSVSRRHWPRMAECPCSQGWREGTAGGCLVALIPPELGYPKLILSALE